MKSLTAFLCSLISFLMISAFALDATAQTATHLTSPPALTQPTNGIAGLEYYPPDGQTPQMFMYAGATQSSPDPYASMPLTLTSGHSYMFSINVITTATTMQIQFDVDDNMGLPVMNLTPADNFVLQIFGAPGVTITLSNVVVNSNKFLPQALPTMTASGANGYDGYGFEGFSPPDSTSTITGTFTPTGGPFPINGQIMQFILTNEPVPEPSTFAFFLFGIVIALAVAGRHLRSSRKKAR